jgi:iron-sulfur cluster assembly protein
MSVTITEKAAKEVQRVMSEQKMPETAILRVGVVGGGCSGFQYSLGFDTKSDPTKDELFEQHGVKVAVGPTGWRITRLTCPAGRTRVRP